MRLTRVTTHVAIAGALAVSAGLASTASASASGGGVSWAFGVSAVGLVNVPQTPQVYSLSGPPAKSLASLPPNPLVTLTGLRTSAGPGGSRARVVGLEVLGTVLSADLITASCAGGRGSSRLVGVSLGGHRLAPGTAPNRTVAVPVPGVGTVSVVLDKQVRNVDGSLTVTAIEVNLAPATGQGETVDVSSATCSAGAG